MGQIGLTHEDLPSPGQAPIDLRSWFGSQEQDYALELEIGSGKGTFLLNQARNHPDVNYIGVEWARSYWRYASDRCRRHECKNVRLVRTDAQLFVCHYLPDACLRNVHIYFPDPWPKKRHHKRRLIQAAFLGHLHRTLQPSSEEGGLVRIVTDHLDYFEWMSDHARRVADLFERLCFPPFQSDLNDELVGTNYERKYRRDGRTFYRLILKRR